LEKGEFAVSSVGDKPVERLIDLHGIQIHELYDILNIAPGEVATLLEKFKKYNIRMRLYDTPSEKTTGTKVDQVVEGAPSFDPEEFLAWIKRLCIERDNYRARLRELQAEYEQFRQGRTWVLQRKLNEQDAVLEDYRDQVDALAKFIMAEIPGEPAQSEGAVECAMRLLRDYAAIRQDDTGQWVRIPPLVREENPNVPAMFCPQNSDVGYRVLDAYLAPKDMEIRATAEDEPYKVAKGTRFLLVHEHQLFMTEEEYNDDGSIKSVTPIEEEQIFNRGKEQVGEDAFEYMRGRIIAGIKGDQGVMKSVTYSVERDIDGTIKSITPIEEDKTRVGEAAFHRLPDILRPDGSDDVADPQGDDDEKD
jgi:hypothetical protein